MIIEAPASDETLLLLVSAVINRFGKSVWRVVNPQFIVFPSEEEHEARQVSLEGGGSLYQLAGSEMLAMVTNGELGFDWTDALVSDGDRHEVVVYVQCVDFAVIYVLCDDDALLRALCSRGFQKAETSALPFAMWSAGELRA